MSTALAVAPLATLDNAAVERIIIQAAEECVLPLYRSRTLEIMTKGDKSLVTKADLMCSQFLESELPALLPGSMFMSEEIAESHSDFGDDYLWIVDPVDGTKPFTLGGVIFAVMVALAHRGQIVRSWIYRPIQQVMLAFDGQVTRMNGKVIRYSDGDLSWYGALEMTKSPITYPLADKQFKNVTQHSVSNNEAYKLALEASDFFVTDYVNPWDTAAPVGIHLGLGGVVAYADGQPYDLGRTQLPIIYAKRPDHFAKLAELAKRIYPVLLQRPL